MEGSFFSAYKCTHAGAVTFSGETKKATFSNMTLIDNVIGAVVNVGTEGDDLQAVIRNSKFYGETDQRDCQVQDECRWDDTRNHCQERTGILISYFSRGGKPPMIKKKSMLPYHKIKTDASFGGKTYYENNLFAEYRGEKTYCGAKQKLFRLNEYGADYHPRAKFYNTRFEVRDRNLNNFYPLEH